LGTANRASTLQYHKLKRLEGPWSTVELCWVPNWDTVWHCVALCCTGLQFVPGGTRFRERFCSNDRWLARLAVEARGIPLQRNRKTAHSESVIPDSKFQSVAGKSAMAKKPTVAGRCRRVAVLMPVGLGIDSVLQQRLADGVEEALVQGQQ